MLSVDLLVTLLDKLWPVANRTCHHAGIDHVEFVRECPLIFYVIDIKCEIRRNANVKISGGVEKRMVISHTSWVGWG